MSRTPSNNSESVGRDSVRTIGGTGRSGWSAPSSIEHTSAELLRPEDDSVQCNRTLRFGRGVDVLYVSLPCLGQRPRLERPANPIDMEPARDRFESGSGAIAAPRPVAGMRDQPGPHRVSDDVARSTHEIGLALNDQRTKPPFEDMPGLSMSPIRTLSKDTVDELHPVGQVARGRLENDVIVIPHEAQSPDAQVVATGRRHRGPEGTDAGLHRRGRWWICDCLGPSRGKPRRRTAVWDASTWCGQDQVMGHTTRQRSAAEIQL